MVGPSERRPDLRVSDADRYQVAELLRQAAGDGRIDLDELDERLSATYAAKTYADLVPLTADLPGQHDGTLPAIRPSGDLDAGPEKHVAIMSGFERRGVWTVPAEMRVLAIMGGAQLDLREATFAAREVVITINAFMGGAEIVVNPQTDVVLEGTAIMGGYSGPGADSADLSADSPRVRVRGVAIMGGVAVTRKR